jgi:AraC-like DNA-binding protein
MDLPPLTYAEFAPGAAVQDLVLSYWCLTVRDRPWPAFRHVTCPDGCVSLWVTLVRGEPVATRLLGPRRTPYAAEMEPGTQCWGIRFRPEMGPAALGRPATSLRDQVGPAHHWFGAEPIRRLEEGLRSALESRTAHGDMEPVEPAVALTFDRWLFDSADSTHPPDSAIRDTVRAIVATCGSQQITTIADVVGLSMRHLQRGFKEAVGLSPKEYAMLRRSRHALATSAGSAAGDELTRVACASGFADPAQLERDVRRLLRGMSDGVRQRLLAVAPDALVA